MKKKSKGMIITLTIFSVVAIAMFLTAGILSGWDVLGWLQSPIAFLMYVLIIVFVLIVAFIMYNNKE